MQAICFGVLTKVWGAALGLLPEDVRVARFATRFPIGRYVLAAGVGIIVGAVTLAIGFTDQGVDALDILGIALIIVGVQVALNSCLVAISTL